MARLPDYSFDPQLAREYGLIEAVLLRMLQIYIGHAKSEGRQTHDGRTWVYNSTRGLHKLHPYASASTLGRALRKLIKKGLIQSRADLNKHKYDHTPWYAFSDEALWLGPEEAENADAPKCIKDPPRRGEDASGSSDDTSQSPSPSPSSSGFKSRRPLGGGRAPAPKAGGGLDPSALESLRSIAGSVVQAMRHGPKKIRDLEDYVATALKKAGSSVTRDRIKFVLDLVAQNNDDFKHKPKASADDAEREQEIERRRADAARLVEKLNGGR